LWHRSSASFSSFMVGESSAAATIDAAREFEVSGKSGRFLYVVPATHDFRADYSPMLLSDHSLVVARMRDLLNAAADNSFDLVVIDTRAGADDLAVAIA